MNHIYIYIFLIFSCLPLSSIIGQSVEGPFAFKHLSQKEGLSSNVVYSSLKDSRGFVWFGTSKGLNRFDGVDIEHIPLKVNGEPSDDNTIKQIKSLYEDSKGNIWIGTQMNGLFKYDYHSPHFYNYKHNPGDSNSISDNGVYDIKEDEQGMLWLGTENGLSILNPKNGLFYNHGHNPKDSTTIGAKAVLSILMDSQQRVWLGTWEGGVNLLIDKKRIADGGFDLKFKRLNLNSTKRASRVWDIIEDNNQRIWFGTFGDGLFVFEGPDKGLSNDKSFQNYIQHFYTQEKGKELTDHSVSSLAQDHRGNLWVGTMFGLNVFHPDSLLMSDGEIRKIYHSVDNKKGLSNNELWSISQDEEHNIWIGSGGGINKFAYNAKAFKAYFPFEGDDFTSTVTSLSIDENGNHWVATLHKGIRKYNIETGEYESFNLDFESDNFKSDNNNTQGFSNTFIEGGHYLWLALESGVHRFDIRTEEVDSYAYNESEIEKYGSLLVRKIFVDSQKRVWLITYSKGLVQLVIGKNDYKYEYNQKADCENCLVGDDVFDIAEDKFGNLWVATFSGISRFSIDETGAKHFTNFVNDPEKGISLGTDRILQVEPVDDGVWIGTESGLAFYSFSNQSVNVQSFDGNEVSYVGTIEKDKEENLWLGTRDGIYKYNPESGKIVKFEEEDGLHGNSFYVNSNFATKEGEYFFGGKAGYSSFFPEQIKLNNQVPRVVINGLNIYNKPAQLNHNILSTDEIHIDYTENFITFEFASLNFENAEKNQYAYKLEGFDEDWIYSGNQKTATYTNLDGKEYIFRVKASNNNGFWNETGASIKLIVDPPFWETVWFRLLALLFCLVGTYLLIKWRTNNLEQKSRSLEAFNQELSKEVNSRKIAEESLKEREDQLEKLVVELQRSNTDLEQFAYAASHDLKEPLRTVSNFMNLLNSQYGSVLDKNGKEFIRFSIDGVDRMSKLISSLLDYSMIASAEEGFEYTNLKEVVEFKILDLSQKIKEKNAEVVIKKLPDIYCSGGQVGMVFYNLINNAVKFNVKENPLVEVDYEEEETRYVFSVRDNGIGIKKEFQGKIFELFRRLNSRSKFEGSGIGLAICKRVITRHNGDIWLESVEGEGTTFFFSIDKSLNTISGEDNHPNKTKQHIVQEEQVLEKETANQNLIAQNNGVQNNGVQNNVVQDAINVSIGVNNHPNKTKQEVLVQEKVLEKETVNRTFTGYNMIHLFQKLKVFKRLTS